MYPIEHALVMDTDHLPGGGGYAVVGVSPGVTDAERVFVSENFGISNYLHDPGNARLYFSVFPVPEGRMALVRRFANGTRRGGGQNRLFVHTLFLDENVLHALHYLPWLLLDQPLQLGDNQVYLTVDPGPLLEGTFSALHWAGGIADRDAFEQLQLRYQQFRKRLEQQDDYGDVDGFDAIAAVQESLRREGRAILPQGTSFEQLSLLAWSMLPPPDRLQLPWTQHDSRNTTTGFAVANAPDGAFVNLRTPSSEPVRRTIRLNTYSVESWSDLCETTLRNGISLRSGTLDWWLKWRDSLEDLLDNPLATDRELLPRLERVASAVRLERRDPWVDELEVLRFLLAIVNRAIDQGQPPEIAVRRWNGLFQRTGIAAVVFRQLPPDEWLDESEKRIGAALVAECFMAGSEGLSAAAGTREAVAHFRLIRSAACSNAWPSTNLRSSTS